MLEEDTEDLRHALSDALRQKPTALFLDEVRNTADWNHVLRFAGSGHLIVTTAHAGSLVEAMSWLLTAMNAKTPAARGAVAERILGLVHIRRERIPCAESGNPPKQKVWSEALQGRFPDGESPAEINVLLPALWRNTPAGVNALVADGLSSIIPYNPASIDPAQIEESALGRRWFVRALHERIQSDTKDARYDLPEEF
ncbi:MAG: Flp pilus assembly complex ATPase component TadA [Fimbriimonas ginsengisoli]|nr:Flp pilus assembly complex ATPase component TadA [Fimbriimonas ginsengisoli]